LLSPIILYSLLLRSPPSSTSERKFLHRLIPFLFAPPQSDPSAQSLRQPIHLVPQISSSATPPTKMPSLRALGLGLVMLLQVATASPLANRAVAASDCQPTVVSKPTGPAPTLPLTGGKFPSRLHPSVQTQLTCCFQVPQNSQARTSPSKLLQSAAVSKTTPALPSVLSPSNSAQLQLSTMQPLLPGLTWLSCTPFPRLSSTCPCLPDTWLSQVSTSRSSATTSSMPPAPQPSS